MPTRILTVLLAALALAGPASGACAKTTEPCVRAAPARAADHDSLPRWLVPAGALATLFAAALALRRL